MTETGHSRLLSVQPNLLAVVDSAVPLWSGALQLSACGLHTHVGVWKMHCGSTCVLFTLTFLFVVLQPEGCWVCLQCWLLTAGVCVVYATPTLLS